MKPSHLVTPRTLAETTFTTGYSSEGPRQYDREDRIVMWACAAAGIALAVLAATGVLA